jgi:hypothetical protein
MNVDIRWVHEDGKVWLVIGRVAYVVRREVSPDEEKSPDTQAKPDDKKQNEGGE